MMEHKFEKSTEHINGKDFRFLWFSELLKRPVVVAPGKDRLGKLTDLVFKLAEPYAEAVGVYIEHGWGKPTEFVPWNRVTTVGKDKITVQTAR